MTYQETTLPSRDGYPLAVRIYEAAESKAVVMCIHGMEEYQDRYRDFAEYLQAAGVSVVTADLRGHGKSAPRLSHIADRDGDRLLIEDEEVILAEIRRRFAGVPVILHGQSMGSIIARVFLQKHSREFHKAVLSGYPNPNPAAGPGTLLADALSALKGPKGYSKVLDSISLGPFEKAVPNAKTPQDWLSVNEENVQRYREDPLCGARFTIGSYGTLFRLVRRMAEADRYEEVKADLPILLISGAEDPCTGGEKGRKASEEVLRRAGFREIEVVTIEGMRHEVLNENDREKVYKRILEFIIHNS